jgi:hypothetical protein
MPIFKAAITRGAVPIIRDIIEISDKLVEFRKRKVNLIGFYKVVMPITKVSFVELNAGIIGTDITIHSFGLGTIEGHRFALTDAKEIKRLIEEKM